MEEGGGHGAGGSGAALESGGGGCREGRSLGAAAWGRGESGLGEKRFSTFRVRMCRGLMIRTLET